MKKISSTLLLPSITAVAILFIAFTIFDALSTATVVPSAEACSAAFSKTPTTTSNSGKSTSGTIGGTADIQGI